MNGTDGHDVRPAGPERETALEEFYRQWKEDSLVMLKWIALQVGQQCLRASFGPDLCLHKTQFDTG